MLKALPQQLLLAIKKSIESGEANVVASDPHLVRAALDHTRRGDVFATVRLSEEGELVFRIPVVTFKELTKWRPGVWRARPGTFEHDFSVAFFGDGEYRVTASGAEAYALADRALAEHREVAVYTVTSGVPHRAVIHQLATAPTATSKHRASA